jgi:hypothetical protein
VPKSLAKPGSPIRSFVHPNPAVAPELVFADKAKAPAGGGEKKAGSGKQKKATATAQDDGGASAAAAAAPVGDSRPAKRSYDASVTLVSDDEEDPGDSGAAAAAAAGSAPLAPTSPGVLDLSGRELSGMAFFFAGTFKGGRPKVIQAVTGKGGSVVSSASKATHILVPPGTTVVGKTLAGAMKANGKIPVVSADFVESFDLAWRTVAGVVRSGHLLFDSLPGSDIVTVVETAQSLAAKAGSAATSKSASGAAAAPAKRRKISDQQLMVDPECGCVVPPPPTHTHTQCLLVRGECRRFVVVVVVACTQRDIAFWRHPSLNNQNRA